MELLTIEEVAESLRVHPVTVRRYIASGRMAAVRVGTRIRVSKEALEDFAKPLEPEPSSERRGKVLTEDDPLWRIIGIADPEETDIAENKHRYLAEAYSTKE